MPNETAPYLLIAVLLVSGCSQSNQGTTGQTATPQQATSNERTDTSTAENNRIGASAKAEIDKDPRYYETRFRQARHESEPMPPVEAVTDKEYESVWQTDLSVADQPAIDVIRKAAQECGFELFEPETFADSLNKPINLNLTEVSRLQIIEEACRQVGLRPMYDLRLVGFREGPRPLPIEFRGPLTFIATRISDEDEFGGASVGLKMIAAKIPSSILALMKHMTRCKKDPGPYVGYAHFKVESVSGSGISDMIAGPTVIPTANWYTFLPNAVSRLFDGGGISSCPDHLIATRSVDLAGLTRSATEIERVNGTFQFHIPTEVETLTIRDLSPGGEVVGNGFRISIKGERIAKSAKQRSSFQFVYSGALPRMISIDLLDENGSKLEVDQSMPLYGLMNKEGGFAIHGSGGIPKSLVVRAVTRFTTQSHDFSLGPIAIDPSKFPAQTVKTPASVQPPVLITTKSIAPSSNGKRTLVTRSVTNNSPLPIESVIARRIAYDAAGKIVERDTSEFIPFFSSKALLAPGETRDDVENVGVSHSRVDKVTHEVLAIEFSGKLCWVSPNEPTQFERIPPTPYRVVARTPAVPEPKMPAHTAPSKPSAAESLLEIDRYDKEGFSQLHRAASSGYLKVASELLDDGANVDIPQRRFRGTPLQYAAGRGREEVLKLLLESNATVDAQDSAGRTPLFWAVKEGQLATTAILLKAGADPFAASGNPVTSELIRPGKAELVKLFTEFYAKASSEKRLMFQVAMMQFHVIDGPKKSAMKRNESTTLLFPPNGSGQSLRGRLDLWFVGDVPIVASTCLIQKNGNLLRSLALIQDAKVEGVSATTKWLPAKKDYRWKALSDAKMIPGDDESRLNAMRGIAKRFSMPERRLALVHTYKPREGSCGAVFAFISNSVVQGLVTIEGASDKTAPWRYTLTRLTAPPGEIRLDDQGAFKWPGYWGNPRNSDDDFVELNQ